MKESAVDVGGVNKMLESDDRVLARLERLAGGVIVGDGGDDGKEVVERVTALVKKQEPFSILPLTRSVLMHLTGYRLFQPRP